MEDLSEIELEVRKRLEEELGEKACRDYIDKLTIAGLKDGVLTLMACTKFYAQNIEKYYKNDLLAAWKDFCPSVQEIEIRTGILFKSKNVKKSAQDKVEDKSVDKEDGVSEDEELVPTSLNPGFTFDNYVVGESNKVAYEAAYRIADVNNTLCKLLYMYSSSGMGKTHLLQSIAWKIRQEHPEKKVVYISADTFVYRFVNMRFKDESKKDYANLKFKNIFMNSDILIFDDMQRVIGKEASQKSFFDIFISMLDAGKQIVIASDRTPVEFELGERIRSRFLSGVVVNISPTNYELRYEILKSKAQNFDVDIPDEVLQYLAENITTNVRELEGAMVSVCANAELSGKKVSLDYARDVMHSYMGYSERDLTIKEIQEKVASKCDIKLDDMLSKRRERNIARPRQIAMYLSHELTKKSLPEIGKAFGRDHTTVIHALETVKKMYETENDFKVLVDSLKRFIQR